MANITTSGTTSYPTGIDTRTAVTDDPGGTEVVAAHHNGVALAVVAVETALGTSPQGSATDVSTRLNVSQNADGTLKSSVIQAGTGSSVIYTGGVFTVAYSADSPQVNQNVGVEATASGNALTFSVTDKNAAVPTSTSAALIAFRSSTATTGTYVVRSIATTTSVVLPAGATLGFTNAEVGRIYLYGCDNAGTVVAGVSRKGNHNEGSLVSTTAITAAATDPDTLYTSSSLSNVPVRLLGYIEVQTGGTAGNWSNNPTIKQIYGPGVYRTGDLVQTIVSTSSALALTTRIIPFDDTVPQSNEGERFFELVVNFKSAINKAIFKGCMHVDNGAANYLTTALFRPQIADAFYATGVHVGGATTRTVTFEYHTLTGSISSTTYTVRIGGKNAGTTGVNVDSLLSGRIYGGVAGSQFVIQEVFA